MKNEVLEAVGQVADGFNALKATNEKQFATLAERIENIEAANDRPGRMIATESAGKARELFGLHLKALHAGDDGLAQKCASDLRALEGKAMSGATAGAGGNLMPEILAQEILRKLRASSPLYEDSRRTTIDSSPGNYKRLTSDADQAGGWVGESSTRTATATATFNRVSFVDGMVYALPSCTEELVHGSAFNVADFVIDEASRTFASLISQAIWNGSGSSQPRGLINTTPSASSDSASPERPFGTLMYYPTGASGGFQADYHDSPQGDPSAVFYDAVFGLKPEYRQRGRWYMSGVTLAEVAKLKDADGRSLLTPQMSAGVGPLLLGYEVRQADHMPVIAADSYSIAFGSLFDCYEIVEGHGLRVTLDDNVSTPGTVRWYLRRYLSGNVVNDEALRLIKFSVS